MAIRKQYKTMQGRIVDIEKLAAKNELVPAIGNIQVNARGDELGRGGKIIRKREDIIAEYYDNNQNFTPVETNKKRTQQTAKIPDLAPQVENIFETEIEEKKPITRYNKPTE